MNPAMDRPEVRENLAEVRRQELATATSIIGYDEVVMLGYRDSGMAGTEANKNPDSFAMAPLDEAVGRLVAIIRRVRPQVIITYPEEQTQYPHPDHLRVHEISVLAFDAAGDPDAYPEAGAPYEPAKLYYSVWSVSRMRALHEKFLELGLESPLGERWLSRLDEEPNFTTSISTEGYDDVRGEALRSHATQVDPELAHVVRAPARDPAHRAPLRRVPVGPEPGAGGRGDRGRPVRRPHGRRVLLTVRPQPRRARSRRRRKPISVAPAASMDRRRRSLEQTRS